ncbi:cell division protein FtsA [Paludibacter sp.]
MKGKDGTDTIIALDFAGSGIRAVAAEVLEDNSVRIFSDEFRKTEGVKYGIIEQPSGVAFNVTSVIKELINSSKITNPVKYFSSALGGRTMKIIQASYTLKLNKNKPIDKKILDTLATECEKAYDVENMMVYSTIPVSYMVDKQAVGDPIGMVGAELAGNFNLVIGNAVIKQKYHKLMERIASYQIESLPLAAEAFALVVAEEEDRNEGCAVIDLGHSTSTLIIYQGEVMQYLRVLPFGGNNLTMDIMSLGLSEANSEKLKCKYGVAMEDQVENVLKVLIPSDERDKPGKHIKNTELAMVIEARLDEMFHPFFNILKKFEAQIPRGIIISGGAAKLNKIKEYFENRTGLPVRFGDHSGWLTEDTPLKYLDLSYAQIIGNVVLANEFRIENKNNKVIEPKEVKKAKSSISEWISQGFFKFFNEDTDLKKE